MNALNDLICIINTIDRTNPYLTHVPYNAKMKETLVKWLKENQVYQIPF